MEEIPVFEVPLERIQPSQFCVDADKVRAVEAFVKGPEDIIIPLAPMGEGYVSLDGHTRMYAAKKKEYRTVRGFLTQPAPYIQFFAEEARGRGVRTPADMRYLTHEEYEQTWYPFCSAFFNLIKEVPCFKCEEH